MTLDMSVPPDATPPGPLGRDAYRIVQEGLTNVHKHVVGGAATVTVQGGPGTGLHVTVSNPLPRAGPCRPRRRQRAHRARRAGGPRRRNPEARADRGRPVRGRRGADMADVIRVLLVDDDPLVRAGLAMIIASASDLLVVGEAGDGLEAVDSVRAHNPEVVLMDIRMPRLDGIAATARLRAMPTPPEVLVLTTFQADAYVLDALRAGASGFLLKDTPPTEILAAIRQVARGGTTLSPSVARTVIDHIAQSAGDERRTTAEAALARVSKREREVAVEIGRGRSNAEIAAALFLSEATVKAHVSRLLTRLDLNNRVQIAMLVHDAGLR